MYKNVLQLCLICASCRRAYTQLRGSETYPEHAGAREEDLPNSRGLLHCHTPDLLYHSFPHQNQQQVVSPGRSADRAPTATITAVTAAATTTTTAAAATTSAMHFASVWQRHTIHTGLPEREASSQESQ